VKPSVSRRQILILAAVAARLRASGEDFWNRKPAAQWDVGEIYQLLNHSPWAHRAKWRLPSPSEVTKDTVKTVVTWESAQPVRDARKTSLAPVYENYYVIGVDGFPSGDNSPDELRQFAVLRSTGKAKWSVRAAASRERIRTSSVFQFAFPRASAPIGPDSQEVVLDINLRPWTLRTKFKPREMLYRGKLAL
jgi:hypothetical protein